MKRGPKRVEWEEIGRGYQRLGYDESLSSVRDDSEGRRREGCDLRVICPRSARYKFNTFYSITFAC